MTPGDHILAAKVAHDNGWEMPPQTENGWLRCASARFPAVVWISRDGNSPFWVAVSSPDLLHDLPADFPPEPHSPIGVGAVRAADLEALYNLLRHLAKQALANKANPIDRYRAAIARPLPDKTEVERLTRQRIGQDLFRAALLDYWGNACAVTGLAHVELLRASHIRPWAHCERDEERLDVYNGLLLAPHLDALFDGGWISFDDAGWLLTSPQLDTEAARLLGLDHIPPRLRWLEPAHRGYLAYHRERVWRGL